MIPAILNWWSLKKRALFVNSIQNDVRSPARPVSHLPSSSSQTAVRRLQADLAKSRKWSRKS